MATRSDIDDAAAAIVSDLVDIRVDELPGGSSAFVARLTLESADGTTRQVVFRQHADRAVKEHAAHVAAKEYHLTMALADAGFAVARPLALHGDATSGGPWIVTEWIDGSTDVGPDDVDSAMIRMAEFLARLHTADIAAPHVPGLVEIEDPVRALPAYLPDDASGRALTRALESGVRREPNALVVLHGDYWPGNVMFDGTELVAVLDWEDAALGDPLVDLACARVELLCAYGPAATERFTSHYLDVMHRSGTQLGLADLSLWETYVSATALASMHRWGLSPADEAARRSTTKRFLDAASRRVTDGPVDGGQPPQASPNRSR